jgi:ubiquinone/menaquinone biosynthesis C-methylase UbiE
MVCPKTDHWIHFSKAVFGTTTVDRSGKMDDPENAHRFVGSLLDEYQLLNLAYPHMEEFQSALAELVRLHPGIAARNLKALELGCGSGYTTHMLLRSRKDVVLTAIDNEPGMLKTATESLKDWLSSGRLILVESDALEYLRSAQGDSIDIVASAWTLHNFDNSYRHDLLVQVLRVLKPGGLFVNGDKYAQHGMEHHRALHEQMERFFEAYLPIGKYEFLREFVLHNLDDEAPSRIMHEAEAMDQMTKIGFKDIRVAYRRGMEAVVAALR